jgi:phospholipid/cholesterol/gamma-HCH transport system substrate-binding protein
MRDLGKALDNRGEDVNDAIGNFRDFAVSGSEVLRVLDEEDPALRRLVKNTGIALAAVNEREGQLRQLIVNANDFFGALASRNDALAETIRVFPTFLDESRATFRRLERFSRDTRPLVRDLIPVAERLQPTLRDVGRFAPDLKRLFRDLDPLIEESDDTLPHAARFLSGAEPVLENLHVYLPELNPILSIFNFEQQQVADFISNSGGALNGTLPGVPGEGPRHYLKQFGIINSRGIGVAQSRPEYERGNAYPAPNYLKRARALGIYESFDCKPTGGQKKDASSGSPPCFVQPKSLFDGRRFPRLGKGDAPLRPPPQENAGTEPAQP